MDEYYLFLDETQPNSCGDYFALGGFAIKNTDYENILKPELLKIKQTLMPNPELPLHLYDMRKNIKGFEFLSDQSTRDKMFNSLKKLFSNLDIQVFCSSIDVKNYSKMYFDGHTNDVYSITLQIVVENFVHFLLSKNAKGSFYIESRKPNENKHLQICYYKLLTSGTLFLDSQTIFDRLSILSFPLKSDNNLGVQLADFIPITLLRSINKSNDYYGFYSTVKDKIYKGYNGDMQNRYGFKNLL